MIKFKGKRTADGTWTIAESYEHATLDHVFVGDDRVEPNSVGRFTGLFDANGDPVFEGDILLAHLTNIDAEVVIVWNQNEAKFQADRILGGKFSDLSAAKLSHWNIIDNIHNRM